VRYLVQTQQMNVLQNIFKEIEIENYVDNKILRVATGSTVPIFKMFRHLFHNDMDVSIHPLIGACLNDNLPLVVYIKRLIRSKTMGSNDNVRLRDMAIRIASQKGNVAIVKQLCKTPQHMHDSISIMIDTGHHSKIVRFLDSKIVDFSINNFEILKKCSSYIRELLQIVRHKSILRNYHRLPADFYRHIVDASKADFGERQQNTLLEQHYRIADTASKIRFTPSSGKHNIKNHNIREIHDEFQLEGDKDYAFHDMLLQIHESHEHEHEMELKGKLLHSFEI